MIGDCIWAYFEEARLFVKLLDVFAGLKSVRYRHVQVQYHQIEYLMILFHDLPVLTSKGVQDHFEGFVPVYSRSYFKVFPVEDKLEDIKAHWLVISDEDFELFVL